MLGQNQSMLYCVKLYYPASWVQFQNFTALLKCFDGYQASFYEEKNLIEETCHCKNKSKFLFMKHFHFQGLCRTLIFNMTLLHEFYCNCRILIVLENSYVSQKSLNIVIIGFWLTLS